MYTGPEEDAERGSDDCGRAAGSSVVTELRLRPRGSPVAGRASSGRAADGGNGLEASGVVGSALQAARCGAMKRLCRNGTCPLELWTPSTLRVSGSRGHTTP
eukprot:4657303-Prymnesium_polylepis.2